MRNHRQLRMFIVILTAVLFGLPSRSDAITSADSLNGCTKSVRVGDPVWDPNPHQAQTHSESIGCLKLVAEVSIWWFGQQQTYQSATQSGQFFLIADRVVFGNAFRGRSYYTTTPGQVFPYYLELWCPSWNVPTAYCAY